MSETIVIRVNDTEHQLSVEPRELLLDSLRLRLGYTSVHAACEQGACGACTVLVDGVPVRSCLMFAVQAASRTVTTVEGLGSAGNLHPVQEAFSECHALQCGFCTPAMVLVAAELIERQPSPTTEDIEEALSGQLCRCTGYVAIVEAVALASARMRDEEVSA